jgi:tetratricopeptide (TPR) repeat protein
MVMDACQRLGFKPIMMEHLAAQDRSANDVSIGMVEEADVYLGIFGHAYGSSPEDDSRSFTEIEYDKAVSLGIAVLPFFADENTPWPPRLVDKGEKAEKLDRLKQKAAKGRIRAEFISPEDLRGLVMHALGEFEKSYRSHDDKPAPSFHPPNIIPKAPEPYIAHPYSLLQTAQVVGRQTELNLLTDWVTTNKQVPASVRLFNFVAIGGMGKSALTWKWFNDIAPHELPNRAGWMWWSFYESDAHYENFIIRALAYASGQSEEAVREMTFPDREDQLWRLLNEQPFVFVLDGLERILLAYSRMDASQMPDDDLDERTANRVVNSLGLPESAAQSFIGKHQLRLTADHRAGQFLRLLARVRSSRVLISTRLYPAEIQADTGDPLPGCSAYFLSGLKDDDVLNLWREFRVSGSREELLPMFRSFGNYPLLVRALAGEVAGYRPAPRDFDKWRAANPGFDPALQLDLKNAKTHVLEYALRGLGETERKVLHTIAAFRMPATWDTVRALLVEAPARSVVPLDAKSDAKDGMTPRRHPAKKKKKLCAGDWELDVTLTELEDRGLLGWDRQANRYDLHPIVRGVIWAMLAPDARRGLYRELHSYFDAAPRPPGWEKVERLEDLTPAVELFDKLIGLERYQDAVVIFRDHLHDATLYRLSASRLRVELLERLFPDGVDAPPRLMEPEFQSFTLDALAAAYNYSGEPGHAASLVRRATKIDEGRGDVRSFGIGLQNLMQALWISGHLREAESAGCRGLTVFQKSGERYLEATTLKQLGILRASRDAADSGAALRRSLAIVVSKVNEQGESGVYFYLALRHLWLQRPMEALALAQRSWGLAHIYRLERDFIRAARLHGEAALHLGELNSSHERLNHALARARTVNLVGEELPTLTALAELHRQQKQNDIARELLEQVWAPAERGPYPLWHADARKVLARVELDEGHRDAAIAAATRAYQLAWCDGPPYAYHYGLTNAKQLLAELGAPEPQLPPFDESKFDPMPVVELNPKDEFWVDPDTLDSDS